MHNAWLADSSEKLLCETDGTVPLSLPLRWLKVSGILPGNLKTDKSEYASWFVGK